MQELGENQLKKKSEKGLLIYTISLFCAIFGGRGYFFTELITYFKRFFTNPSFLQLL